MLNCDCDSTWSLPLSIMRACLIVCSMLPTCCSNLSREGFGLFKFLNEYAAPSVKIVNAQGNCMGIIHRCNAFVTFSILNKYVLEVLR